MNKNKILFFTPSIDGGGAEKILLFVAEYLHRNNFYVEILTLCEYPLNQYNGIEVKKINYKKKGKLISKISLSKRIRSYTISNHFEALVTFGVAYSLIIKVACIGLPIKLIVSERRSPMNLSFLWKNISKLIYKNCDGVIYQLKEVEEFYNFKNTNTIVIHNPYMLNNFENKEKKICKKSEKIILLSAAARLDEYEKGMDILIDAFELIEPKYKNIELHLYGDIVSDNKISRKLRNTSENIKVFPKEKNIIEKINQSTIFILPSRLEGIPNILLEALGNGNATISADCPPGGPRLLTQNGKIGELFENRNSDELSKKIVSLLADEKRYNYIKEKSVLVRNEFEEEKIGNLWLEFIEKTINGGNRNER